MGLRYSSLDRCRAGQNHSRCILLFQDRGNQLALPVRISLYDSAEQLGLRAQDLIDPVLDGPSADVFKDLNRLALVLADPVEAVDCLTVEAWDEQLI